MRILLTTRNHLRDELEDFFETISFNLNNFEEKDQIKFVSNYWASLYLKENKDLRNKEFDLEHSAQVLINKVNSSLNQRVSDLIGIPLQTKMIADIFFDKLGINTSFETIFDAKGIFLFVKFDEVVFKMTNDFSVILIFFNCCEYRTDIIISAKITHNKKPNKIINK